MNKLDKIYHSQSVSIKKKDEESFWKNINWLKGIFDVQYKNIWYMNSLE